MAAARIGEVFWRFLLLGLTSFGGPAAHIGYFRYEFVERLRWVDEKVYGQTLALCQFLPGPASSQVGFAIGCQRAGVGGGIAAFLGFTLPSFLIMWFLATWSANRDPSVVFSGVVQGLKLLAVIVVADASVKMYQSFCTRRLTAILALSTAIILWLLPGLLSQFTMLFIAALLGLLFLRSEAPTKSNHSKTSVWPLLVFITLFASLPLFAGQSPELTLLAQFYQAGSLVFGGGHVVLPLLQNFIGDAISADRFLLGYSAAQAVPGPMFSLAAFLGAELYTQQPLVGALVATVGIFLPGFLLVIAFQNAWLGLASNSKISGAIAGLNAGVVGLLFAVLYQPVVVSSVHSSADVAVLAFGFILLRIAHLHVLWLVLAFATVGALRSIV